MSNIVNLQQKNLVLWTIFLATLGTVLIAVTSMIFPSLVMMTMNPIPEYFNINPFEPGLFAVPFLITSFFLLAIAVLYFKGRLPKKITKLLTGIKNFEISKKSALVILVILIAGFITFTANQLYTEETIEDYTVRVKPALENWTINDITKGFDLHVKYFLITVSMKIFGSYRVIPYLATISLLVLTYFFTKLITKSRFAGIVSTIILLQSGIFLTYNSSPTYDNFWILFYLLSLYTIYKFWPLSPISFIASLFAKPLTAFFIPFTLYFIHRTNITKRRRILVIISYVALIIIAAIKLIPTAGVNAINTFGFWSAFNAFAYQMRFDPLVAVFLLPVTVLLFLAARKRIVHADSSLLFIMSSILSQPIIAAVTENASEPYRLMPLITFFAIGVGILLSKNTISEDQGLPNIH